MGITKKRRIEEILEGDNVSSAASKGLFPNADEMHKTK